MKGKIAEDIGEEIISRLMELIAILESKAKEKKNGEERTSSYCPRE